MPRNVSQSSEKPVAGRATILGRPNVGKSTLLNALVGQRLAIATPRPGTTRSCLLGVCVRENPPTQIAFVDTPGMGRASTALHHLLVEQARQGLADADVVALVVAAPEKAVTEWPEGDLPALEAAKATGLPIVLVVNKVDRVKNKDDLLPTLDAMSRTHDFAAIVPISATIGTNLEALISELRKHLPEGTQFESDFLTDKPERYFVRELIRESAIQHTRNEVPYGVAVLLDEYTVEKDHLRIDATLVVEKESHKKIVVGAGGSMIKAIGTEAREAIKAFVGMKTTLKLWVKVVPGWTEDPNRVRELAIGDDQ